MHEETRCALCGGPDALPRDTCDWRYGILGGWTVTRRSMLLMCGSCRARWDAIDARCERGEPPDPSLPIMPPPLTARLLREKRRREYEEGR